MFYAMRSIAAGCGLILLAAYQPAAPAVDTETMISEARSLDERFVAAVNAADLEGVMSLYWNSPELVLYPPDGLEARGRDAVRQAWQGTFAALPGAQVESINPHFMAAGDAVVSWGRYRVTPVGAPALEGRFTVVAAQRDGRWVWIFDHGSFPLPPPPPPPPPPPTDAPATPPG